MDSGTKGSWRRNRDQFGTQVEGGGVQWRAFAVGGGQAHVGVMDEDLGQQVRFRVIGEERRWNRVGAVVFMAGEITGLAR